MNKPVYSCDNWGCPDRNSAYADANTAPSLTWDCASPKCHPIEKSQVLTVRSHPVPQPAPTMETYETKGRRDFGEAQVK